MIVQPHQARTKLAMPPIGKPSMMTASRIPMSTPSSRALVATRPSKLPENASCSIRRRSYISVNKLLCSMIPRILNTLGEYPTTRLNHRRPKSFTKKTYLHDMPSLCSECPTSRLKSILLVTVSLPN